MHVEYDDDGHSQLIQLIFFFFFCVKFLWHIRISAIIDRSERIKFDFACLCGLMDACASLNMYTAHTEHTEQCRNWPMLKFHKIRATLWISDSLSVEFCIAKIQFELICETCCMDLCESASSEFQIFEIESLWSCWQLFSSHSEKKKTVKVCSW